MTDPARPTAHVVYPAGPAISAPAAIGRRLLQHLGTRFRVVHHEWDAVRVVRPDPGDVLLGHPHPAPWTVFRMSSRLPGWRRVVVLCPYAHGSIGQVAFLDTVMARADAYLAITGPYWARRVEEGPFRHWAAKLAPLDMAVDRRDFPRIKGGFAPPGKRRFVYVGDANPFKNVAYLAAIARAMPEAEVAWLGRGDATEGIHFLGFHDFATRPVQEMVAGFDFLLTVGNSDANPTTVLEAMAWGLVPVCTPQSGYEGEPGIPNVPLDDVAGAVAVLRSLQQAPAGRLEALRDANDAQLATRFTWERFLSRVDQAIDAEGRPPAIRAPVGARMRIRLAAATSQYSPLRPANTLRFLWSGASRSAARWSAAWRGRGQGP
jgi:glycosyltransferase involved in cell wall biosynthesis